MSSNNPGSEMLKQNQSRISKTNTLCIEMSFIEVLTKQMYIQAVSMKYYILYHAVLIPTKIKNKSAF